MAAHLGTLIVYSFFEAALHGAEHLRVSGVLSTLGTKILTFVYTMYILQSR